MSYIGLDIGTSGCKAAVINKNGDICYSASEEYPFESPKPGYVELNPDTIWAACKKVLTAIAPKAQNAQTIAVSSIGESMVILDKNDKPLYNGITYLDQRCTDILPLVTAKMDAKQLHRITGVSANQMFTLNKIIWFRQNAPEILEQADKYFLFGDYFTYLLSGIRGVDNGTASRTMFYDAMNHCWSREIADIFDIPIDQFSPIVPDGKILGPLKSQLVKETGLPSALQVIMGIHDQCAGTLGTGALLPGEVLMSQGSTESINCVIHKNQWTEGLVDREICFEPYIDEDHYIIITGNLTHGSSITWFMRNFFNATENTIDYEALTAKTPDSAGDVFFIPYLSRVNLMDSGNLALGGFWGVDVTVDHYQMYRAVLEGLSCETRVSIEILENLNYLPKKIVAAGGASSSPLYMQIKSDTLQKPIRILENNQAGLIGLAIVSAVACGDYANYTDASKAFIKYKKTYQPEKDYKKRYQDYKTICTTLKDLYNTGKIQRS